MPTIHAYTDDPQALLDAIAEKATLGKLKTWRIDAEGDLRHPGTQYEWIGYFTVSVNDDNVVFHHVFFTDAEIEDHEKPAKAGQMLGRLSAMLLSNFCELVSHVDAHTCRPSSKR